MIQQLSLIGISAQLIFDENFDDLKLHWVAGQEGSDRCFDEKVVGLASSASDLVGHLNLIHPSRLQVCGEPEISYLNRLQKAQLRHQLVDLIAMHPPCIIIADNQEPPENLSSIARDLQPPFTTHLPAAEVIDHLRLYLTKIGAPSISMHGVFMDILGLGVLITGESGLGKSELGLELISRGHGLVADDAVDFSRLGPDYIEGRCPIMIRDLLEVRGLGLLDIKTIFGETAVRRKLKLRLIVQLVRRNDHTFERLPLETQFTEILGLPIRTVKIQVAEGRNLAVLVEAAVRNTILQLRGINTLEDFINRQQKLIQADSSS